MAVSLLPWITQYFPDSNGNPLAGGSIETFAAGTSTPKNTWSDPSGTVLNANPIPLGANGQPISGGIYGTIGEAYKIVVKNASGVVQPCSKDNVLFPATTSGGGGGDVATNYRFLGIFEANNPTDVAVVGGQCAIWRPTGAPANVRYFIVNTTNARGWSMAYLLDGTYAPIVSVQGVSGEYFCESDSIADLGNGCWLTGYNGNENSLTAANDVYVTIYPQKNTARFWDKESTSIQNSIAPAVFGDLRSINSTTSAYWRAKRAGGDELENAGIRFSWGGGINGQAAMLELFSGNKDATTIGAFLRVRSNQVEVRDGPLVLTELNAGTPIALVGRDTNGVLVSAGSAPAGGFVALSGHNDLGTTPWSIADDIAFEDSDAGIQFDPMGAYQAHIKGNLLIDQGVANVLTLYRQAFAIGTTQDLIFGAQNDLGNATPYVHQHSYITANAAGAEEAEWRLQTRVAGSMVERIRANATGGILSGIWRGNFSGYGMGAIALDLGYTRVKGKFTVDSAGGVGAFPMYQVEVDSNTVSHLYNAYYSGGWNSNDPARYSNRHYVNSTTGDLIWAVATPNAAPSFSAQMTLGANGKLSLTPSTANNAMLNIGAFGVTVTSPSDGDIWKSAADTLSIRMSTNTRTIPFLEKPQTWNSVQTFSSTPVISSTTASTTAGAIYKRTNYGMVGYEAGMAQEFLANVYTGPVGTALTNSTTETDVTGGTALFGTRTTSTSVWQSGTRIRLQTKAIVTNSAANTLTLRIKYGTTIVGTITITSVVASATPIDIWCEGVATAAPGASVETIWTCGVEGSTAVVAATAAGSVVNLATNAATAVSMTAQWTTALATSTYHTKATEIILV